MRERGGGEVWLCVLMRAFTCIFFFSMASNVSTQKIDEMVKNLERPQLLSFLGMDDSTVQVGDFEALRSISASTVHPITIFKTDVSFLNKVNADCCSGAIIHRFKNATVGIPCYSHELESGNKFCDVCAEIWEEPDSRGFYCYNPELMPNAAEFYSPAKQGVLWKLPFMAHMEQFYSDEIQVVKDLFEGTESELPVAWPNVSFKEVSSDILLRSGVLHRDADKSRNPYRRDSWEHSRLLEYLRKMISCWLRMRTTIDSDELSKEVKALHHTAKSIGLASMWRVQREHRRVPVLVGPLVPADIMLAGFRSACAGFKVLVNNVNAESEDDIQDLPEFAWGDHIETVRDWASRVTLLRRPARKPAPKFAQSPKKAASQTFKDATAPRSPSQVKIWYAAKGTARPGAYAFKHVADSYNVDGTGQIKKCKSLSEVRKWLQMPAPRTFYEDTPRVKTESDGPSEFFAVKGGSRPGVYLTMAEAVDAKNTGGGTFATFITEQSARDYVDTDDTFVVWAGRDVGIMTQEQCIAATQGLSAAKMKGPMSEEAAFQLWSQVQPTAVVVTANTPPTSKKSKKKKKRFYYAVAVGKVPGVYDDWKEAECQVKGVRPNLYAKFATKKEAQAFVDNRGRKPQSSSSTNSVAPSSAASSAASSAGSVNDQDQQEDEESQGKQQLQIETPSIQELEAAEADGKVRVFACHTEVGKARIALSFDKAIAGVSNPAVQVINSESTLLDNLAVAEVKLRNDKSHARKSVSDRLAEARKRAGAKSHAVSGSSPSAAATTPNANAGGYHTRVVGGRSAVGRAKEVQMIQHHFIDHQTPIKVVFGAEAPYPYELDEDMDLPNAKAIFDVTTSRLKDLTITDFFKAKEKSLPAWPLLSYYEFMRLCRRAQRMCQTSTKPAAVANAAALNTLMDICLQVQHNYQRTGRLGRDNIRLKARLFMHLQHACMYRVVYANAIADTVFDNATDPFCARLPGYVSPASSSLGSPPPLPKNRNAGAGKPVHNDATPVSGCYLCVATDHYSNDKRFHPLVNGRHAPLSAEKKKAILDRIDASDLNASLKASEKRNVRRYWSQHEQ